MCTYLPQCTGYEIKVVFEIFETIRPQIDEEFFDYSLFEVFGKSLVIFIALFFHFQPTAVRNEHDRMKNFLGIHEEIVGILDLPNDWT